MASITSRERLTSAERSRPRLLILNQMAGPLTWELAEDLGTALGSVAMLTGHPDTLAKGSQEKLLIVPAVPYQRGSYPRRVFSWLCYMAQAFLWVWRWPRTTPLLLFSNPPMLVWLGCLLRMLRGQRYAVMVHDIYPDVLTRLGGVPERHLVMRIWRWLNRRAYQRADVVMTLGEHMAATLAKQFDPACTPAGEIKVIYPWADTETIRPIPKAENPFARQHGQVGKLTVMYSGNMGLGHDIETMLEAATQLRCEPGIHFMFIGAGPKWQLVADTIRERELSNVTLLPWQPEEMLPYSLAACDVAMVSLDEGAEGLAFPSKSIYAMAAGSALLGLSRTPSDLQIVIEGHQCGINVAPGDVSEFTKAILNYHKVDLLLKRHSQIARKVAEQFFSRPVNVRELLSCIHN